MSDNLVLDLLRAIRADVGEIKLYVRDLKHRMTAVEIGVANLAATESSHYASLAARADRTDDKLERIERRLELSDARVP
jgi:hypothetical protein